MPKTKTGKWAVSLIGGFFLFFVLLQILIATGQRGGDGFFDNPWLAIPGVLAAASGVAGFIVGIISLVFHRERSWLVYLSIIIGAFITVFISGEFISPH